jgi:2-(1,2-epoxy-1,2-dihydrophenyl)acetyl-CoA isomerase
MAYQKIEVEHRDKVLVVRLNDPAKLNAIGTLMIEEISRVLNAFASSSRAVVVLGNGRSFCSGAALGGASVDGESDRSERDFGTILETHINPLMMQLRALPVPWICAVRGSASGVGASLALAADLVVAGENAFFLQAFSRIGLVPDGGSSHILVRTIGRVRAMELMLLGDRLPAPRALEWGLINRVVADALLEEETFKLAAQLAGGPTVALGITRQLAWSALDEDWGTILKQEREFQRTAGRTLDADEGIRAFLQKRAPAYTGS